MVKKIKSNNPQNTEDNKCFQYAITAALNYRNIDSHLERISKLKHFIDNYNGIIFVFQQGIKTILRSRKTIAILQ